MSKKTILSATLKEGFVGKGIKDRDLYLDRQTDEALRAFRHKPYSLDFRKENNESNS